jgi:transposase
VAANVTVMDQNNLLFEVESLQQRIFILTNEKQLLISEKTSLVIENLSLNEQYKLLISEKEILLADNERLQEQLTLLRAKSFGKSSEKLKKQIEDVELKIEENEAILGFSSENAFSEEEGEEKKRPRRQKLPEHLTREEIILKETICSECGGEEFRKIADDVSEVLEYVPSSFKVMRYIRPRCVCIACEKIVQAYPASKAIDKGKAGAGLLAHVLVQKYCNHLPLYRQCEIYKREDIEISRTTMAGWVGGCSKLLEPLIKELRKYVFASSQIHTDDTPIKVLAPGFGKTKTSRIWTYVRDGRGHGDQSNPAVCYYYSPDRKGIRPAEHLKDFNGILHADAYAGYNQLYTDTEASQTVDLAQATQKSNKITEAGCFAHMRRKFYEITVANDKANIAIAVLEQIAKIYEIEAQIKGLSADERKTVRISKSKSLVLQLFAGFKKAYTQLPKKSITARAINYALNNEKALTRFLDNGHIEIDNNAAERAMRSIAIGRKNWLFAGSDVGGQHAASIYSLTETAKLNNINPWQYLKKVLEVIGDHKANKIADLLPWNIILQ